MRCRIDTVWRMRKVINHSPIKALAISPQIEKERTKQLLKTRELGNQEDGVTRRYRLIERLKERHCLWDVFCKDYHVREKRERAYEEIENEPLEPKCCIQHVAFVWPPRPTLCNIVQQCWIQQCWMMLDPFGRALTMYYMLKF